MDWIKRSGQITVEAILVLGVFVIIILGVSVPNILNSGLNARDVAFVSDARYVSENLVSAADGLSNPYEKRTVVLHVPGTNFPGVKKTTTISVEGNEIVTYVNMVRLTGNGTVKSNETYNITLGLPGSDWRLYNGSSGVESSLIEADGSRYRFIITHKNITYYREGT